MSELEIEQSDLDNLTPEIVLKYLRRSFWMAQKDIIKARREEIGLPASEEDIQSSVDKALKRAFMHVGGDIEHPTKESLLKVYQLIEDRAESWGTPAEQVKAYRKTLEQLTEKLS